MEFNTGARIIIMSEELDYQLHYRDLKSEFYGYIDESNSSISFRITPKYINDFGDDMNFGGLSLAKKTYNGKQFFEEQNLEKDLIITKKSYNIKQPFIFKIDVCDEYVAPTTPPITYPPVVDPQPTTYTFLGTNPVDGKVYMWVSTDPNSKSPSGVGKYLHVSRRRL